jgi:hypothetical protein
MNLHEMKPISAIFLVLQHGMLIKHKSSFTKQSRELFIFFKVPNHYFCYKNVTKIW